MVSTKYGAESNPTGNPIGGGNGYSNIILPNQATWIVSTLSDLKSKLSQAVSGNIIYVTDTAQIDMSGQSNINIPTGVIVASGRGRENSSGALLYVSSSSFPNPLFKTGENIRFTGLRLRGPSGDINVSGNASGIYAYKNCVIDNCDISQWTLDGIRPMSTGVFIHHNYIHHCRKEGLGYGVETGHATQSNPVSALIEANLFDYNRHSIAAEGDTYSSYEARYNIAGVNHTDGVFDRHGTGGGWNGGDGGDNTLIHHNTIKCITEPAVSIRGEPRILASITNNWFYNTKINWWDGRGALEIWDRNGNKVMNLTKTDCPTNGTTAKNVKICDNWYSPDAPPDDCPVPTCNLAVT